MTDHESLYEYVKGKGWVISSNTITMSCGTVVRWERRMPTRTEYSVAFYNHRSIEDCVERISDRRFRNSTYGVRGSDDNSDFQVFTLVPA